jgi:hypothetical protein
VSGSRTSGVGAQADRTIKVASAMVLTHETFGTLDLRISAAKDLTSEV